MNNRGWFFITAIILLTVCAGLYGVFVLSSAPDIGGEPVVVAPELNASLADFHHSFLSQTTRVNNELLSTADALSGIEVGDPQLDVILRDLYNTFPTSVGVSYVLDPGTVGRSAPLASLYSLVSRSELKDIREDSFANASVLFIGPIYSPAYGDVVCFAAPVYAPDGTYRGYVCIAQWPRELISETSFPGDRNYENTTYRPWIVFTDGVVLSSPSNIYLGENALNSSTLRHSISNAAIQKISKNPDGAVRLSASSEWTAVWTTAEVNGRELRLILSTAEKRNDIPLYPANPHAKDIYNATVDLYTYAREHGKERTLTELKNPTGAFASEKLRYFAYDFNGVVLYDGFNPQYAGENMLNFRDVYGLRPVATEMLRALQGGGYTYMYAPVQSGEPNQAVLCILYVLPMDDEWFVAVSQSILDHTVTVDPSKRDVILRTVHNAASYILIHGKESALADIMSPNTSLLTEHDSLFAMDYNGTILADSLYPQTIGKNAFSFVDMYGASTMREIVMVAREGDGYCYFGLTDSATQESKICLVYVESMGDDWCLGSYIMLDEIPLKGWQQSTGDPIPGNLIMAEPSL